MTAVYIVDDDPEVRKTISWLVQELGYRNHPFVSGRDFVEAIPHLTPGCLLVDLRMEEMSGIELLEATAHVRASFPAVLVTGHADVESVVSAMKTGAVDVLQKPVTIARLAEVLATAPSVTVSAGTRSRSLGGSFAGDTLTFTRLDMLRLPPAPVLPRSSIRRSIAAGPLKFVLGE